MATNILTLFFIHVGNNNKKLIRRWDSERDLFYDDIRHVLQSTIDMRMTQT